MTGSLQWRNTRGRGVGGDGAGLESHAATLTPSPSPSADYCLAQIKSCQAEGRGEGRPTCFDTKESTCVTGSDTNTDAERLSGILPASSACSSRWAPASSGFGRTFAIRTPAASNGLFTIGLKNIP